MRPRDKSPKKEQQLTELIDQAYELATLDYQISQRPEVAAILQRGADFSQAQGHQAILDETIDLSLDWSNYARQAKHPVTLVHGTDNCHFPCDFVEDFAGQHKNFTIHKIDNAGLLLFHSHGAQIMKLLQQEMNQS